MPSVMVMDPALVPAGTAVQSMLAQMRSSLLIVPAVLLSWIHGAETCAVHDSPALPFVNTSMNRRSSVYEEKRKVASSAPVVSPSTATPRAGAEGEGTSASAGRRSMTGNNSLYGFMIPCHFPPASVSL